MYDYIASNAEAMRQYLANNKIDLADYDDFSDAYCKLYDDDKLFECMMNVKTPDAEVAVNEHLADLKEAVEFFSISQKEICEAYNRKDWQKFDSILREYLRHDAIFRVLNEFYTS